MYFSLPLGTIATVSLTQIRMFSPLVLFAVFVFWKSAPLSFFLSVLTTADSSSLSSERRMGQGGPKCQRMLGPFSDFKVIADLVDAWTEDQSPRESSSINLPSSDEECFLFLTAALLPDRLKNEHGFFSLPLSSITLLQFTCFVACGLRCASQHRAQTPRPTGQQERETVKDKQMCTSLVPRPSITATWWKACT